MARTTQDLIEGIMDLDIDSGVSLDPFIDAANGLVTESCTGYDEEYTSAYLTKIETWLAAHFCSIRYMIAVSEKAGSVSERFQSKVDVGFSTSHYGQTAMRLDYKGGLARLDNKLKKGGKSPNMTWVGKEEDDL